MNDPYIWLETVDSERALDWVKQENVITHSALKSHPLYEEMYQQALDIYTSQDRLVTGEPRDGFFYNFWQDAEHPQGIWRRTTLAGYLAGDPVWDVLFDLDVFNREAQIEGADINWVWHGVECLRGSSRCLMELSPGGSDADVVREFDLESREFVSDGFFLKEAKQGAEWLDEDTLVVTTKRGEGSVTNSGYARTAVLWKRGTSIEDAEEIFAIGVEEVLVSVGSFDTPEGRQVILYRIKTFHEREYYHVAADGRLTMLPAPLQSDLKGFHRGQLVLSVKQDWSITTTGRRQEFSAGTLVSYSIDEVLSGSPLSRINTIYRPEERSAVQGAAASGGALYLEISEHVVGKIYRATFDGPGWQLEPVTLPGNGSVNISSTDDVEDRVFLKYENFLVPDSLFYMKEGTAPVQIAALPEWFDTTGMTISQREAISADGTRVPYFLVHRSDIKPDGSTPTLLYGYGGFQVSYPPFYSGSIGRLWLERGGAFALSNIRGGGEFGPAWHQAALKQHRQRAFDDFIATAEHLIATGVTSPPHLGIQGGSNGGLLVGAVLVQRPELFGAVVCEVPLLDMLRYHLLLAGASWIGEYGDPEIPEERAYLETYSPYQLLDPEADYPRVYVYTSTRDDRVHPGHARKFVARLKQQGHDVYYFERIEGGHSSGANLKQAAESVTLRFAYLWGELARTRRTVD